MEVILPVLTTGWLRFLYCRFISIFDTFKLHWLTFFNNPYALLSISAPWFWHFWLHMHSLYISYYQVSYQMICVFVLIFIIIIVIQCIDFVLVHYLLSFMNLKFYI